MIPPFAREIDMIDTQSLTQLIIGTLEDSKALSIVEMDISEHSDLAERMIVCSATSGRHAKTLADKAWVAAKNAGTVPIGQEGDDASGWILLDLDVVIVHVMLADIREYYKLEDLWSLSPDRDGNAD
jgi:ribosome-associated protein